MQILKPLWFILTIGNFLILYRNISFSSAKLQIIMYLTTIAEIILIICNGIIIGYFNLFHHFSDIIYVYMGFADSVVFIFFSLYHSKRFQLLLNFLDANSDYLMKDGLYLKDNKRKNKIFKVFLIAYIAMKLAFGFTSSRYYLLSADPIPTIAKIVFELNVLNNDIRFTYEYCLLLALLYLISEQIECIIRYIVKKKTFIAVVYQSTEADVISEPIPKKLIDDIATWSLVYTYLSEATCIFNRVFGVQITIMLISTICYICIFLYSMAYLGIYGFYDTTTLVKYAVRIIVHHLQIFLLSRAAQRIQNNLETLRRCLGRLLLHSLTDTNCYKATKDLLRLVSYNKMKIEAFGSITVDMTLPPTCIILFTSYTVIALQFNNVI